MIPVTLYHIKYLLPYLERVSDNPTSHYEMVVRYVGALQMYVTLPSREEVTIDYHCAEADRMTVFTVKKLHLDAKGCVVRMFTDPA